MQGEHQAAESSYGRALTLFEQSADPLGYGQTLGNLGTLYLAQDRIEEAAACLLRSLTLLREMGDHVGQAQTLNNLAIAYRRQGLLDEALNCYERSLLLRREFGDRSGELVTLLNLVRLLQEHGPEAARSRLAAARALAEELNDSETLAEVMALETEFALTP